MNNAKEQLLEKIKEFKGNLGFTEKLLLDSLLKNSLEDNLDNLSVEEKEKLAQMALELIEHFEKLQNN